jgi:outer membrane lipase/esterase
MNPASTRLAALLLCASAPALSSQPAAAQASLVLGDSLSDAGNAFRLTGGAFPDPQFYKDGRLSNGPVWADRLAARQGFYADLLMGRSGAGQVDSWNFAVAGALSGGDELDPATMRAPGLLTQIRDYKAFASAGLIVPTGRATSALIWSGANDYGMRAADPTRVAADDPAFVDAVVGNIRNATNQLLSAGVGEIVLLNQFELSRAPTAQFFPTDVRAAGDKMTAAHNAKLLAAASDLHGAGGRRVILVDIDRLFDDVFANPAAYGFASPGQPCLPDNGPPECATAAEADKRVFWDGTHLTSAAHALVAATVTGTRQAAIEAPRQAAVLGDVALTLADAHRSALVRHLTGALPANASGLSVSLSAEDTRHGRDALQGRSGYHWDGRSFGIAVDQTLGSHLRAGIAGSRTAGDLSIISGLGSGNGRATTLSAFLTYRTEAFSGEVHAGRAWLDFGGERATGFNPAPEAQAETSGSAVFADANVRYAVGLGPLRIDPAVGLRWTRLRLDGWQETGGGLMNVRAANQERTSLIVSAGARAELPLPAGPLVLRPFAGALYERELTDGSWTSAVVLGSGQRFAVEAEPGDRNWLALEGGIVASLGDRVEASVAYRTRLRRAGDEERAVTAGLKYRF